MSSRDEPQLAVTWPGMPLARLSDGALDIAERELSRIYASNKIQRVSVWAAFNEERFRRGQCAQALGMLAHVVDEFHDSRWRIGL